MGTYPARKTPEQYEAACVAAYNLRCEGMFFEDIAAEMAGPPHFCGGKSTAVRWVRDALGIVAAKGDPLRKRRARREMSLDALDALRVQMAQDVTAGNLGTDRSSYYRLQLEYIRLATQLSGARAAPELPRVRRPDGSKTAATPGELLDALSGMPVDELLDALNALPDERTDA